MANANTPAPPPADTTAPVPAVTAPVSAPKPRWRRVHNAALVTLPDGREVKQGAIFDAACFDADLRAHYEEEGYLLHVDEADLPALDQE